ncbi:UNVERIFIED_CONTAM: hypothetical protein HDU68_009749 [Siphonaria sp. JEL0065]|nr:hypothetical protein HDU68_009749 [Siphonaria sp. JEL0065]
MTADQVVTGSQQTESTSSVKDDSHRAASLATPRLESHTELKTQNAITSASPISPISPVHSGAIASARESDDGFASSGRNQSRNSHNNKRNHGNTNRNSHRLSNLSSDSSEPKPYLAAPFQSDPAVYNAAAAAAAAAQASAPHNSEIDSSPTNHPAALQQYVSPTSAPRPPYVFFPHVMYYPSGQSSITPTPDTSAFFNPITSPVAAGSYDSVPPQATWSYGPQPQNTFNRPPIMSPNPGNRNQNRNNNGPKTGQSNSISSPPPTTPSTDSTGYHQQQSQNQHVPRSGDYRSNQYNRNVSDGSTISNSSSLGRASNEFLNQQPMYPHHQQHGYRGNSRRESLNNIFSPNFPRALGSINTSVGASGTPTESDAGDSAGSNGCSTNLYIRGLAPNSTDESLYELGKGYGRIYSSKAILDLVTQECKGFGFVMYETEEETRLAFDALVGMGYQVSYARTDPRSPTKDTFVNRLKSLHDDQSTNIYVSNLPPNMDEAGLIELLKPRTVVSAKILRDPTTQKSRGVGFARLETREDAISSIHELHGKLVADSFQHLHARFADSVAQKRFKISSHQQYGAPYGMAPMMSPYLGGQPVNNSGEEGGEVSPIADGVDGVYFDQYSTSPNGPIPYGYGNSTIYYNQAQQMYYGNQYYPMQMQQYSGQQVELDAAVVTGSDELGASPALSDETVNEDDDKQLSEQLRSVQMIGQQQGYVGRVGDKRTMQLNSRWYIQPTVYSTISTAFQSQQRQAMRQNGPSILNSLVHSWERRGVVWIQESRRESELFGLDFKPQAERCIEMIGLKFLDRANKSAAKEYVYGQEEIVQTERGGMDEGEMKEKLQETFLNVKEGYHTFNQSN